MTVSAHFAASAVSRTFRPAPSALLREAAVSMRLGEFDESGSFRVFEQILKQAKPTTLLNRALGFPVDLQNCVVERKKLKLTSGYGSKRCSLSNQHVSMRKR